MYLREPGLPTDDDRRMLDEAARVARVVFAAEQVRAEQRQLARILEETPDLVTTVAPDGRVLFMNRAARSFLHGSHEAGDAGDATLHAAMRVLAPCDPPDDPVAHARRAGAWQGDVLLRRADGAWVPMLQVMLAHHDETGAVRFVSTTARDLSAVRTAEAALAASEARFRALTEAAPVGVFETDRAGDCTYANRHLAGITGWSTEALAGSGWLAAVHPDDIPALLTVWDEYCRTGRSAPHSYRFTRPDGATRHLLWTAAPMTDHAGAISGHVGIVQDITAAREDEAYQEAIRRERGELAARAHHAQRMEALGALAGGVAHDFNNLLSVLRGGLELLREEVAPHGAARAEVDELIGATERATAMTQRLLAFSRHQVLQPTAIDPNAVVEGACSLLRRLVGEHISVRTTLRPLAGTVRADRSQLEQVLINLVVNARDAMPNGGEIAIETADVAGGDEPQWSGDPAARLVRLVVRDRGAGMDEATLARAMEPFFTTKPVGHGTGLGLSMAYGVVTQSGGAFAIASRPGVGTTVTILLPLDRDAAAVEPPPAPAAP
ncbi:MAG: PAS domain S-box protein, partial [Gemmatimonadaceae bacterium]|nr:PAS domain S-box protein [Gemmatimonadaceae bacterium]